MQLMKNAVVMKGLVLFFFTFLSACAPGSESSTASTLEIAPPVNPYQSSTETPAAPTATVVIPTEAPLLPTATPFIHEVQPGDTLYGLAITYNVSLDKLVEANLGVDTSLLSIGTELVIPLSEEDDQGFPTPIPMPLELEEPACYPTRDRDLWCLIMVGNQEQKVVENITMAFNLYQGSELVRSQAAYPPLNYLFPGQSIPVAGLIMDADPDQYQISAVMITALPSEREEPLTEITDYTISYALNNTVATIVGSVEVLDTEKKDHQIWIAAAGLSDGDPVGVRKWISTEEIKADTEYSFEINLYSLGPSIDQVLLFSELH